MPAVDAIIIVAIVAAFAIFAGVLAWVEHQTRNLSAVRPTAMLASDRASQA